jgi:hypothetical protein
VLELRLNPNASRKKLHKIISPENALKEIGKRGEKW